MHTACSMREQVWSFWTRLLQYNCSRSHSRVGYLDEDATRQTGQRGTDIKVMGESKSATFRCHSPALKTHGHVTFHQPPALLAHKKLLNCDIITLRTGCVSAFLRFSCHLSVCFLVALLHSVMPLIQAGERSLPHLPTTMTGCSMSLSVCGIFSHRFIIPILYVYVICMCTFAYLKMPCLR